MPHPLRPYHQPLLHLPLLLRRRVCSSASSWGSISSAANLSAWRIRFGRGAAVGGRSPRRRHHSIGSGAIVNRTAAWPSSPTSAGLRLAALTSAVWPPRNRGRQNTVFDFSLFFSNHSFTHWCYWW